MAKAKVPSKPSTPLDTAAVVGALGAGALLMGAPLAFVGPLAAGVVGADVLLRGRRKEAQNYEDLATGGQVTGLPGSGKTGWALVNIPQWMARGWGGCWASPKGAHELLGRIPAGAVKRVDLIQPYSQRPRGLNPLQTYTDTAEEREQLAALVAHWFDAEHSSAGDNMLHLLHMAALGLLEWAAEERRQVCLLDLADVLAGEEMRAKIEGAARQQVARAFASADKATWQRTERMLSRMLASDSLLCAVGHREGINLADAMRRGRWIILDAPLGKVPQGRLLCRMLATMIYLQVPYRSTLQAGAKPWLAVFDEVQQYPTKTFADAIAISREYGVGWYLIHQQMEGQITSPELEAALQMAGNRIWFRQTPGDARGVVKASGGLWEESQLVSQPARHYRGMVRRYGVPVVVEGKTPNYPPYDEAVRERVLSLNEGPMKREAIIAQVKRKADDPPWPEPEEMEKLWR